MMRLSGLRVLILAFVLCSSWSRPVAAQEFGVRAGASADPDQFYFGGHVDTGPIVEHLHFRPNLEIGLGDDVTLIAANLEFAYFFPLKGQPWSIYAGAGPAINIYDGEHETDAQGGFNILFGLEHRKGLMFEVKIGTIDSPDVKFGIGYTFR